MPPAASDTQHDRLRVRLEEELASLRNLSDNIDYDWFLRGHLSLGQTSTSTSDDTITDANANNNSTKQTSETVSKDTGDDGNSTGAKPPAPISPLKSPSMANSPNNKAKPSVSTSTDDNDVHLMANLTRSKTADARLLSSSLSRSSANSSFGTPLHKTATNVDTSDIGVSKQGKNLNSSNSKLQDQQKQQSIPQPNSPKNTPIPPPSQAKKKGFFKKLFGSKSEDSKPEINIYKQQSNVSKSSTTTTSPSLKSVSPPSSTASSISKLKPSSNISSITPSNFRKSRTASVHSYDSYESSNSHLQKKKSIGDQYKDIDPQLSAYLNEIEYSADDVFKTIDVEHDYNFIYSPFGLDSVHYDVGVIPAHPDAPKLPSALSSKPKFGGSVEKELFLKQKREKEEKESSMFGSLLHRTRTNTTPEVYFVNPLNESEDTPPLNFKPIQYVPPPKKILKTFPLQSLKSLKPMKKVAFATTTFVNDPPQQIPSRNPRKGNVEICSNGELIIHKIDPQEKINSATGIVVGGTGHLKLIHQEDESDGTNDSNLNIDGLPSASTMKKTESSVSMSSQTSFDQTIKSEDRIEAARKAREHHTGEEIDIQKENLTIDKPMVKRKKQMDKPVVTLKMDELYTRCCHLREILPIPATLKQIPKGSIDPIPMLHLRNPRPSMIEILSFTDFIRIAPIICVSFDGVTMTNEMFRIVLSSLLYKRYLEKLSLRNTPIDENGWKMLCSFLSLNKSLKKLDITQCPPLDVHTQRIKKKSTKTAQDTRMTCNLNDRSDKNWALFTASLIFRGGIEDLILTGCKIPDLKLFSNLLNLALVKTNKIGLAYNNLTLQHCYVIARWLESNPHVIGLDLAYNDLSSFLKPFTDYAKSLNNEGNKLGMLSLNSCNLIDCCDTIEFFNSISKLPKLAYLDLSSNPKLMKTFSKELSIHLPLFHSLGRLNIDNNDFDTASMVRLLESISMTPNLSSLSIMGNEMNEIIAESLCKTLQNSQSLYSVFFDKESVSSEYQQRIGLLTMKNVEKQLYKRTGEINGITKSFADIISDADRKELSKEIGLTKDMSFTEAFRQLLISKGTIEKEKYDKFLLIIINVRSNLKLTIQELTKLNLKNQLSLQGKEMLIRLLSMDGSIDKAFELINDEDLNSIKNNHGGDTSKIQGMFDKSFEKDDNLATPENYSNKLELLIKGMKNNPFENTASLKKFILSANDPYDLISMLKHCKKHNITIQDLFLKGYRNKSNKAGVIDEDEADNVINKLPENALDEGVTIDKHDLEIASDIEEDEDEDNSEEQGKLQTIYDQILQDFSNIRANIHNN